MPTDQIEAARDKAPSIALTTVAVVVLLVVISVLFKINSKQSRSVNPPSTQSLGDDNTRQ